jgi:hypothetical protein
MRDGSPGPKVQLPYRRFCLSPPDVKINPVLQILSNPSGTVLRKRELARLGDAEAGKLTPEQLKALQDQDKSKHIEYPNIRVPGLGAIAGVLISKWAKGEVEYGKDLSGKGEGKARI